jgi:hypothetical protein
MIILVSSGLLNVLTLGNKKVSAMALWPFVIFRNQELLNDKVILNHERIHHRQQLELLIIPYYIWYFLEYWIKMFKNGFRHFDAYVSVSFEQEAFDKQSEFSYLNNRQWLASWTYFKKKFKKQ